MRVLPPDVRTLYPWRGHTLDVGAHTLHYLDEGEGEPLLFVHGNPTWSFYWRHLIRGLSDTHRCIAVDHLGCGLSDKPQDWPYTLEGHVNNLSRLIEDLDLQNATLVVHDWGGAIGFGAALRHRERFKRIVIFNTGIFEGPIPLSIKACRWPLAGDVVIRGLNGFLKLGLIRGIADRSRMAGAVGRGYLAPYDSWDARIAHLRFVQDIPLEAEHPTRPLFEQIGEDCRVFAELPVLILWGEQDFCFTMDYFNGFAERFPNAEKHLFSDASHFVVEDAHERILPLMRDFLTTHQVSRKAG